MASQAQIASQATLDVGGQAITDIDHETQKEASLIRDIWETTRDSLFAKHEWGFAKVTKAPALESEDATLDEKWTFVYALPKLFVSLLDKGNDFDHEIRGQSLYCDVEDLIILYIQVIEDTSKYPTWFVDALIAKLRPRLAISLAKKGAKAVDWYQIYQVELNIAKNEDARQDRQSDDNTIKHTTDNDSWVCEATS
jgi:hypothetical protein